MGLCYQVRVVTSAGRRIALPRLAASLVAPCVPWSDDLGAARVVADVPVVGAGAWRYLAARHQADGLSTQALPCVDETLQLGFLTLRCSWPYLLATPPDSRKPGARPGWLWA